MLQRESGNVSRARVWCGACRSDVGRSREHDDNWHRQDALGFPTMQLRRDLGGLGLGRLLRPIGLVVDGIIGQVLNPPQMHPRKVC